MSIPSPLQPRLRQILGFVAEGRLTRRGCLTALHFRSKQTHTYDFHQTRLRRGRRNSTWRSAAKLVLQLRALVSLVLGSLCQGPRIGFTFPCLPPILCAMLGAPFLPRSSAYRCTPASLGRRLLAPGAFPNGHSQDVLWEEFGIRSHFPPISAKHAISRWAGFAQLKTLIQAQSDWYDIDEEWSTFEGYWRPNNWTEPATHRSANELWT